MNTYDALDHATRLSCVMRTGVLVKRKDPSDTRCIYVYRDEISNNDKDYQFDMAEEGWVISDDDLKKIRSRAENVLKELDQIEAKHE